MNQMKKRIKEWMDMFMVESVKEIKIEIGFVLTLKRMKWKKTMTSLPYYLTNTY